jgi:hypothetical protein
MSDKNLSEAEWKKFAKGRDLKDAALLKALAAFEKAKEPEDRLKALATVEKEADALRKLAKGDKETGAQLDAIEKALAKEEKLAKTDLAEAQESESEEEESPALLTSKLIPLLRLVKKGETMQALIANAGKEVAVLLSRRAIAPARRKLLQDYLQASTVKPIAGTCIFEENAYTFVVQSQASGLAKKLKAALLLQTELRLKVRVRGEDGELDDDGEPAEDEGGEGEGTEDSATAGKPLQQELKPEPKPEAKEAAKEDAQKQSYEQRMAQLEPRVLEALRAPGPEASKLRAVADFARGKAEAGAYGPALQALDQLAKLLDALPQPAAPPKPAASGDAMADFKARLAGLMEALKAALASGREGADEQRKRVAEAGALAQKGSFEPAGALLDQVERWLTAPAKSGIVELQKSRLAWDGLRKTVQQQLKDLEGALRTAVAQYNEEESAEDQFEEGDISEGVRALHGVLDRLDTRLIDKLDQALNAEGDRRAALHAEAAALVKEYQTYVDSDPLIAQIDNNGFIATTIRQQSVKTLAELAQQL